MEKEVVPDQRAWTIKLGLKTMKESSKKETILTKFPNPNNSIFILCDCKSEVLLIDYDKEIGLADFAIYQSQSVRLPFWQKIRHIWHILIKGSPYSDQMVLTNKHLKEIKQFIEQIV